MYFNDKNMVIMLFSFFVVENVPIFPKFLLQNGRFGSTLTQISRPGQLINNFKCIDVKATILYLSFGKRINGLQVNVLT